MMSGFATEPPAAAVAALTASAPDAYDEPPVRVDVDVDDVVLDDEDGVLDAGVAVATYPVAPYLVPLLPDELDGSLPPTE
jgi:hypothetical protein